MISGVLSWRQHHTCGACVWLLNFQHHPFAFFGRSLTRNQAGDVRSTVIHFEFRDVPVYGFVSRVYRKIPPCFALCKFRNLSFGIFVFVNHKKPWALREVDSGVKRELKGDVGAKESSDFCPAGNCGTKRQEMCETRQTQ